MPRADMQAVSGPKNTEQARIQHGMTTPSQPTSTRWPRNKHEPTDAQSRSSPDDLPQHRKAATMNDLSDRLWSVHDAADYLGIPYKTLYNWRTRGIGPRARRVGRYLRYEEHEVRAWFAAQNETVR